MKIGSTQSHLEWPPCRVVGSVSQLLYLLQRQAISSFYSITFFVGLGLIDAIDLAPDLGRSEPKAYLPIKTI
jgi:hypothetical protein